MAALTWRNVDTPNLAPALAGYAQFSQLLGNAFSGATNALDTFDTAKIKDNSNTFIENLLTAYSGTPDKLQADLASGAVFQGVDRKRLNNDALNMLARRPEDLQRFQQGTLTNAGLAETNEFTGYSHGIIKTDRATLDASKPVAAALLGIGLDTTLSDAQKLTARAELLNRPESRAAIKGMTGAQITEMLTDPNKVMMSDLGITGERNTLRAQDDSHIISGKTGLAMDQGLENSKFQLGRDQWTFGKDKVEYAEGRAGMAVGQEIISASQTGEQANRNMENSAIFQGLSGPAKAVARAQVVARFGADYSGGGPVATQAGGGGADYAGSIGSFGGEINTGVVGGLPVVGGRITSDFGQRSAPMKGASTNHMGIDIGAPTGTAINAPSGGKVIMAGKNGAFGNMVKIDHGNGVISEYGHMNSLNVKVGDVVPAGANIGGVGSTGRSTGPHTHYGISVGGRAVNPQTYRWGGASTSGATAAIAAAARSGELNNGVNTSTWAQNLGAESEPAEVAAALRGTKEQPGIMPDVPVAYFEDQIVDIMRRGTLPDGTRKINAAQAGQIIVKAKHGAHEGRLSRAFSGRWNNTNVGKNTSIDGDIITSQIQQYRSGHIEDTAVAVQNVRDNQVQMANAMATVRQAEAELARLQASGIVRQIEVNAPILRAKIAAARNQYMALAQQGESTQVPHRDAGPAPGAATGQHWYDNLVSLRIK